MSEISLEFLQGLLKEDHPEVTLVEFEGAPGSKRGDNYTSMVYRISLKGTQLTDDGSETPWESSIIYKCLPESVLRREAFKSDQLFCNEVAFYTKIWPAFSAFQRLRPELQEPLNCVPKCYLARNDCVILKDLKQAGFVMPDRRQGLTVDECYAVLERLSHFHAISLAMKCHDPDQFYELLNERDGITEVFFMEENISYYRGYYNEAIQNALHMVQEELAECPQKDLYLSRFRQFCAEDTFFQTMVELVKPREPLAVVCHGDCWTNNFLFRYDDGGIADMCIVDFQLARYGSLALDLVYLVYLCLSRSQRRQHCAALLRSYSEALHARLAPPGGHALGVGVEALHDMVVSEFRLSALYGLGIALDMFPIMNCDSDEAPNLYQTEDSESTSVQPVRTSNAACRSKMTDLVQELVDDGLL